MKKRISAICALMASVILATSISSVNVQASPAEKDMDYYTGIMEEFRTYEGYLDQCKGWGGYKAFVNKDYDGDKKTDRVKRTYDKEKQTADYVIEFGNGEKIYTFESFYELNVPFVECVDLTGDGDPEVIFAVMGLMSTALPLTAIDLRVYTHG